MSIQKFRNATVVFAGLAVAGAASGNTTAPTAQSQAMTGASVEIETETLRRIREEIVAADDLSVQAKNVKIIVTKDLITLRGTVASQEEGTKIIRISKAVAPKFRIENRMTVSN